LQPFIRVFLFSTIKIVITYRYIKIWTNVSE
jgi:hypothetical protein